jgi:hypothetical protein
MQRLPSEGAAGKCEADAERRGDLAALSPKTRAIQEAVRTARDMLSDKLVGGSFRDEECIELTTQDGAVLRQVPFKFVIMTE